MDMSTKIEHRADGSVTCMVGSASEYITFARNRSGEVRWVARTAYLSRGQFTEALKLACRKIGEAEREVRAAASLEVSPFQSKLL